MLPVHELALLLPEMSAKERAELKSDIQANGLVERITTYQGKVLDGRHRDAICDELGITPKYIEYRGSDPAAFVVSKNLRRRHLTTSQRAAVAALLVPHFAKAAKQRQGNRTDLSADRQTSPKATTRRVKREATAAAAKAVGTSTRSVARARRVQKQSPEMFEKVKSGEMSADKAESRVRNGQTTDMPSAAPKAKAAPTRAKRAKNWNGKTNPAREKEVHDKHREAVTEWRKSRRPSEYSKLVRLQLAIDHLCTELEDLSSVVIEYDNAATIIVARDIHDDLITLGIWQDRQLSRFQGFASDTKIRATIAKLRAMTVENGCPAPEAAAHQAQADKLEGKLANQLAA